MWTHAQIQSCDGMDTLTGNSIIEIDSSKLSLLFKESKQRISLSQQDLKIFSIFKHQESGAVVRSQVSKNCDKSWGHLSVGCRISTTHLWSCFQRLNWLKTIYMNQTTSCHTCIHQPSILCLDSILVQISFFGEKCNQIIRGQRMAAVWAVVCIILSWIIGHISIQILVWESWKYFDSPHADVVFSYSICSGHWPIRTQHSWYWPIRTQHSWYWPIRTQHLLCPLIQQVSFISQQPHMIKTAG